MPEQSRFTPDQVRSVPLDTAAKFLETGREVEQPHLRVLLAKALRQIARLEGDVTELQNVVRTLEGR
jgi:hypothetical protein